LSRNGFRVTVAGSAAEARERRTALDFDLIVLDVMMPGQTGLDFAGELRRTDDVPILMLTARAESMIVSPGSRPASTIISPSRSNRANSCCASRAFCDAAGRRKSRRSRAT